MLSPKTQYNLRNAKSYFEEHLSVGDYYSEGERIGGDWFGKGAESLGLGGMVEADDFVKLCDNLDPRTGESLTVRQKTTRRERDERGDEREVANRRVFYDFTLSPPKSVSIVALLGGDDRILRAHDRATRIALAELEKFAATRVHSGGDISDRATSNIVAAIFRHDTSRALDPHVHSHCILFNATFDAVEDRWKALQNYEMLRAQKYVENVYYHELARDLRAFGYAIQNYARGDFEIKGVPRYLCERFSKRHREIDEQTQELLGREPDLMASNRGDVREHIAYNKRSRKIKNVAGERLRGLWASQISADENTALAGLLERRGSDSSFAARIDAASAVRWAEEHLFDRRSVVHEHELWRHALEHARGADIALAKLHATTARAGYLRDRNNSNWLTTREVLSRELEIVNLAKSGSGACGPLAIAISDESVVDEAQRKAVTQILRSRDFVTLFRGAAGSGKSFALREMNHALREARHKSCVIAPQRQQVKDLEREGFTGAQTVSEFLTRKQMPVGAVVIVDEAGQLGAKQMLELLTFVKANSGRVILSGDTRQHGAVASSDALRAIERYSGLAAAELNEIRRQDPARGRTSKEKAWITEYKRAVEQAANGKIAESFARLEKAGAIVECTLANQQEKLAAEYLELAAEQASTVVVSQTWSEIHKVNENVRAKLQEERLIGADAWHVIALQSIDLTNAQKRDGRFYSDETVIAFNRNSGGFAKGEFGKLVAITAKGLVIEARNKVRTVSFDQADHITVCREQNLVLANGDRLQLKANAKAIRGERVVNGELVTLDRVEADGRIRLRDGRTLGANYRQFVWGYAVTSYAAQGKTADCVLFSDSTIKAATNAQQWYVTISRGRRGIKIFTSDKEQLRENIVRSGSRALALELRCERTIRRGRLRRLATRSFDRSRALVVALQRQMAAFTAMRRGRRIQQETAVSI
jgi:conjugative relaxase-like TrwC/TraI family protein